MQCHRSSIRLFAAIGAVAVIALGTSAPSFATARKPQPGKTGAGVAYPAYKRTAVVQLVSLGYGSCGDLEVFVPITNGRRGLPMC
jgi:hypothetical protein